MNTTESALPEFERPPVNEVVLGLQFEALEGLQAAQVGLFWSRLRKEFPKVEQQPPLASTPPEDLSGVLRPVELKVEMRSLPPAPRVLFISETGNDLLQLQSDRFHANWRRVQAADVYPRYPHVRENFERGLNEFMQFVADEGLGELRVRQVEVSYLNLLVQGEGWERLGEIDRVLSFWRNEPWGEELPEPELGNASMQFIITGDDSTDRRGRLYVDFGPSLRASDLRPSYGMNFTARLLTQGHEPTDVLGAVDLGRVWIVRTFAALTTPEMHQIWGRNNGNS
jgi:uncharacterized protein (TIGR04255 family)